MPASHHDGSASFSSISRLILVFSTAFRRKISPALSDLARVHHRIHMTKHMVVCNEESSSVYQSWLAVVLLAVAVIAEAQQPKKSPPRYRGI